MSTDHRAHWAVVGCALFAALTIAASAAPNAQAILAASDAIRNPGRPFGLAVTLIEYRDAKQTDTTTLNVYSKADANSGQFRSLIRFVAPPRDANKLMLKNGNDLWFYDPSSKASIRLSPQQRLLGQAANGDVVTVNLARDYQAQLAAEEDVSDGDRQNRHCYKLALAAITPEVTYHHIEMWIDTGNSRPVKAKFYTETDRLLKTAYYRRYQSQLGAVRPTETVIIDGLDPNWVTVMRYSDYGYRDIPDAWYQRDYLPRFKPGLKLVVRSNGSTIIFHPHSSTNFPGMRALAFFLLLAAAAHVRAQADDAAALSLADKTPPLTPKVASDWRVFAELAWAKSMLRDAADDVQDNARLFFGAHYDKVLAPGWRVVFADLLNVRWQDSISHQSTVNTLMDAYLSWQPTSEQIADAGRINTRYGVAFGYNPTDYFRTNAVRSIISIDPASLRENRMGSVMVRGQTLWTGGSLTVLYSPKLADQLNDSAFNLDLGATNFRDRWLLAASHEVAKAFSPQLLLYGQAGQSPQLGVNVTALVNDATVAYAEYSGGRRPSLSSQALTLPSDAAFRSQWAAGFAYTSAVNLSLSLEYEYNGAGLDEAGWDALRSGPGTAYAQYRVFAARVQEPPTKQRVFGSARWQDAGLQHLDLSAFAYFNLLDSSRQLWIEGRYHWTHVDVALQWQLNSGAPGTEYGALPVRQSWQALVTYFF